MIAVIADDFTGAAELAARAAAHGLHGEVWIGGHEPPGSAVDLVAIDSGTRSLDASSASARVTEIARQVAALGPSFLYMKTDSVLRGHVAVECAAAARTLERKRVLLVPANPSRKRSIVRGRYLIDGQPLDRTAFSKDPESPAHTADVQELLGNRTGFEIEIPDLASAQEIDALATCLDATTLPAGAADFFAALLHHLGHPVVPTDAPALQGPTLWISGSHAAWFSGLSGRCTEAGLPVITAPDQPDRLPALLAIGEGDGSGPARLLERLVTAALATIDSLQPATLLVEGGETANGLLRRLGWSRFTVTGAGDGGIGLLAPLATGAPTLIVKPGSYPWPEWCFGQESHIRLRVRPPIGP